MPAPLHRMNNEPTTQYKTLEIGTVMNIAKQEPPHKQGHNKFIRFFCNASARTHGHFYFEISLEVFNGKVWEKEFVRSFCEESIYAQRLTPSKMMHFDQYGGTFLLDVLKVPEWFLSSISLTKEEIQVFVDEALKENAPEMFGQHGKEMLELGLFQ